MKKIFVAATAAIALAGAATAASAANFVGSYTATYHNDDNLDISTQDLTSGPGTNFSFPLTAGNSTTVDLFKIWTYEGSVDNNDKTHQPFTLTFNFTAPSAGTGTIEGDTYATTVSGAFDTEGHLVWDGTGTTTVNFGANGVLTIDMSNVNFGTVDDDGYPNYSQKVTASFSLAAPTTSAIPEPMSWALMLTGFFGMGAAMRANRRQGASLTA